MFSIVIVKKWQSCDPENSGSIFRFTINYFYLLQLACKLTLLLRARVYVSAWIKIWLTLHAWLEYLCRSGIMLIWKKYHNHVILRILVFQIRDVLNAPYWSAKYCHIFQLWVLRICVWDKHSQIKPQSWPAIGQFWGWSYKPPQPD